jgi:transposase
MLPKEYGSGSTCRRRFQEWNKLGIFKKTWIRLLKTYDRMIGINRTWQSLDSIHKVAFRGQKQEIILQIGAN